MEEAARRVANLIEGMTAEAVLLAKAAGKTKLKNLEREDLRSMTGIPLVGSNLVIGEGFGFTSDNNISRH